MHGAGQWWILTHLVHVCLRARLGSSGSSSPNSPSPLSQKPLSLKMPRSLLNAKSTHIWQLGCA